MLAVLPRCQAVFLTKMFDESTGVVKSAVVGDLSNGVIRAAQLLFGVFQTQPHDILGVGHIQILLEESGQIAFGQKLACSKLAQGNILIPVGMNMIHDALHAAHGLLALGIAFWHIGNEEMLCQQINELEYIGDNTGGVLLRILKEILKNRCK